jgi:hypothetical protein
VYVDAVRNGRDGSVRDSSSVQIVTVGIPRNPPRWSVSAAPVISIAFPLDSLPYNRFQEVGRLASGHIVVRPYSFITVGGRWAGLKASVLLVLDSVGRVVRAIGRQGRGPGEFEGIDGLLVFPGDSLLIRSAGQNTIVGPDGRFVRRIAMVEDPIGRFADGSLLTTTQSGRQSKADRFGRNTYHRYRADGTYADTIAGPLVAFESPVERRTELSPSASVALGDSVLYYTAGDTFEISVFSQTGRLSRIIRLDLLPKAITQQDIDRYGQEKVRVARARGYPPPDVRQYFFAQRLPAITSLQTDKEGNIWLRRGSATSQDPVEWIVLDPRGRYLAGVTLPGRLIVSQIGRDYVLGSEQSDEDEMLVRMYRLHR